ncbi:MAG: SpoIIIAH-like family protein [Oscillospiraceae bacterium]|nr:SpoIIIAH-like family protein [Oscillospiraceae bacterium]
MKKIMASIGKKNIIIISGILLIGIAVYLNLTLQFDNPGDFTPQNSGYIMDGDGYYDYYGDESKVFGQAALVDNLYFDFEGEDMGSGTGESGMESASWQNNNIESEDIDENYFAVAAVSRRRARDESIELLNHIINSAESMPDIRDRAMRDIESIAGEIEKEANIEILVKAKGFTECVAVVSGENASIIVKTDGLMPNEAAQIKEIAYEQAGIMPANVKIVERN